MAEFTGYLQNLEPSFSEMNSNLQEIDYQRTLENFSLIGQEFLAFSNCSFSNHQHQPHLPVNFTDNTQSFVNISPPVVSATGLIGNVKSYGGRKRKRKDEKDMEKPNDVIHVRAKRGQATDSHSLAEKLRREKINERLRCLQELVPGCYKTMGMAVMLDVIINYVQSLQNQIEFLSIKLTAASMYHDFNSDGETMERLQGTNAYDVQEMDRIVKEGYGGSAYFHSAWPL